MPTIKSLYEDNREPLKLEWIAGRDGAGRMFRETAQSMGVRTSDLVGHLNLIHPERIHVLGAPEVSYVTRIEGARRTHYASELMQAGPLGLIIAEGLSAPAELINMAERVGIPVFATPMAAAEVIDLLRIYLTKALAPHCTMHGVLMDVLGMGVLIAGESGVGKSELGLELISRGHGLVADDVVDFARVAPDSIEGRCPPLLANLLEVRGLGLLDIKAIFGESAVRRRMKLRLIVELRRLAANEVMERLPLAGATEDVLGLPIYKVVIPVAAGRNLAVLLEAAVRNTILKLRGVDTLNEFVERQRKAMGEE
ncbi:MAG: HPr kinase/phosphorylase [Burkholderiales bacterium]|jgi:HPr kinase/phosphorylase|nr:HPr kinase/phosphorylase [Burkholderiales bacterium]